jgi:hypothetical protein
VFLFHSFSFSFLFATIIAVVSTFDVIKKAIFFLHFVSGKGGKKVTLRLSGVFPETRTQR